MRQHLSFREHFRRGNAAPIQIAALHVTHRWREMDSKFQFRKEQHGFGERDLTSCSKPRPWPRNRQELANVG